MYENDDKNNDTEVIRKITAEIVEKIVKSDENYEASTSCSSNNNEVLNVVPSLPTLPLQPPTYYRVPPTYSTVIKMGPVTKKIDLDSSKIFSRIPPPSYAEVEGIWSDLPRQNSSEEVIFGPDPVYMVCPHCSAIVVTETFTQRSAVTHLAALALCLFGCWPCCLLPYFMDSCKNTYHHCPVCNYFFGLYRPW